MRTTLSLNDDVPAALERVHKETGAGFKVTVNPSLQKGLREMTAPAKSHRPHRTPSASLGRCRPGNIDDAAEILAIAEGVDFS